MADISDLLGDATPEVVGGVVVGALISAILSYKSKRRELAKDFSEDKNPISLYIGALGIGLKYSLIYAAGSVVGGFAGYLIDSFSH